MDFTVNIKITAPDISEALKELALAYAGRTQATATDAAKNLAEATMGALERVTAPSEPVSAPAPVSPTNPTPAVPAAPTAPVAPATPAPAPDPAPQPSTAAPAPVEQTTTSGPKVTLDQIKVAGAGLAAQGKTPQLMQVVAKYGVRSVLDLTPDQYDAIADDLRAMGATF